MALYGTSYYGAGTGCYGFGCGTVFAFDPRTGAEKVIYPFTGLTDGGLPWGGLIAVNGRFYGTTQSGGAAGFGTVFELKK
ncbi:MAG TPA: hypothetical protein VHX61_14970 [Rhizomicrobium sp.]|nr:hypothetical protein [Rhizomicrobium sp.]